MAELYGVETKVLNQTVKRNIERYPKGDFYKSPRGETINNVAEVESRAELVRAMPRCSNVSKKHGTSRRRSAVTLRHQGTASRRDATLKTTK